MHDYLRTELNSLSPNSPYEDLQEVTLRLQTIIQTAIDGIIIIDDKGIVESMNPAAGKLFGYEEAEVLGHNIRMLMPSPYKEQHDHYISRYLETGHAKIIGIGRTVNGRRKDGTIFPMRLAVSAVQLQNRQIFTGIIHDLTEMKWAEDRIHRLNEELEGKVIQRTEELASVVNKLLTTNKKLQHEVQERKTAESNLRKREEELKDALEKEKELSELKSRFVSMASHEFRTPLSTILSSVSLIGRYTETEQQAKRDKHIERIKSSVRNLTGILNDFLSLSKLEEGEVRINPTNFQMQEFCKGVIEEISGLQKTGQTIRHLAPDQGLELFQDEGLLKNVLFNLLSNALKYSPENSTIYCIVEADATKDHIWITVKDEGIGIPEADQAHLFTRFFRAANSINIQGTGLGLNIVKRYVELMGGQINFESIEGKGSTFKVSIPQQLQTR
ncbi:MAG: PAS domain S-box protein [Phaeodactylibacter sp.]|nr:PAS domain S-box protein [Phaeodactylibacter sp.]